MNKQWVQDSHYEANRCRELSGYRVDDLDIFEYLDMIGLYETCWIIYDFDDYNGSDSDSDRIMYGYPSNE